MTFSVRLLLILLSYSSLALSQGWELISPRPTEAPIEKYYFIDDQIGWAQAYNETLLYTSDGGNSWQTLYPGLFHHDIQFLSENVGWGIAQPSIFQNDRQIYKTIDGGRTWELKAPNEFVDNDIFFLNENLGWAGGSRRILHTKDGGNNWEDQAVSLLLGRGAIARSILFLDSLKGWAVTTIDVIKTVDGGASWEVETAFPYLTKLTSVGESYIWGIQAPGRTVWRSMNGGASWESFQFSDTTGSDLRAHDIYAFDEHTLFIAANFGVYSSIDAGETWARVSGQNLSTIWALSSTNLWGGNENDYYPGLYASTDAGYTWVDHIQSNTPPEHRSFGALDFESENVGYIAGGSNNSGFVLKTLDGGDSWTTQLHVPGFSIRDLEFADLQNGWTVGEAGTVFHTANGGLTWQSQHIATPYILNEVSAIDSLHAWTVGFRLESGGFEGKIWATKNGGLTWEEQTPGIVNSALFSVCFLDTLVGWAAGGSGSGGSRGSILKTTDGGLTWVTQRDQFGLYLRDIEFVDKRNGWFAGEDPASGNSISRTMDGGATWIPAPNFNAAITGLEFVTSSDGWALGLLGLIFRTFDGGETWQLQETNTFSYFEDIYMMNRSEGIAIASRGSIFKTETGGLLSISVPPSSSTAATEGVLSSFPNPFNPSTTIQLQLNRPVSEARIDVYDILGRHVTRIYRGPIYSNESTFTWDGKNKSGLEVPSGLYFIHFHSASYVETIKILKVD